jgi:class 3 adenylate cyclase
MAVFPDAAGCLSAGLAIQAGIARYNREAGDVPLIVKLGAHVGPCLAVNLNERLDYFGTTVNIAARVQGESVGDDYVLTEAMTADPGVARLLAERPFEADSYEIALKGLSGAFRLMRLWPLRAPRTALPAGH